MPCLTIRWRQSAENLGFSHVYTQVYTGTILGIMKAKDPGLPASLAHSMLHPGRLNTQIIWCTPACDHNTDWPNMMEYVCSPLKFKYCYYFCFFHNSASFLSSFNQLSFIIRRLLFQWVFFPFSPTGLRNLLWLLSFLTFICPQLFNSHIVKTPGRLGLIAGTACSWVSLGMQKTFWRQKTWVRHLLRHPLSSQPAQ